MHRTRSTQTGAASELRADEAQLLAQDPKQLHVLGHVNFVEFAVNMKLLFHRPSSICRAATGSLRRPAAWKNLKWRNVHHRRSRCRSETRSFRAATRNPASSLSS